MRARRPGRLALALFCCAMAVLALAIRWETRRAPALLGESHPVAGGPPSKGACSGPAPEAQNAAFEREVVDLVNAERQTAGLPALEASGPLSAAARWFARDMAEQGYFARDHGTYRSAGERLVLVCDWRARITSFSGGWTALGENIASGAATPRQVVSGWMGSSLHRARILDSTFSETGVGYWSGGPQGSYWVQDFGRRGDATVGR